mmetsp:Transcript_10949/g.42651  ORF Transcript_10949/g.42651 Transcript_10949/m.42651 type:complete len:200 (-) Transcript_10949:48-647(-)
MAWCPKTAIAVAMALLYLCITERSSVSLGLRFALAATSSRARNALTLMTRCQPTCALNWNLSAMHASTALMGTSAHVSAFAPGLRAGSSRWSAKVETASATMTWNSNDARYPFGSRKVRARKAPRRVYDATKTTSRSSTVASPRVKERTRHDTVRSARPARWSFQLCVTSQSRKLAATAGGLALVGDTGGGVPGGMHPG